MSNLPQLSIDLIEELSGIYPERSPDKGEPYADIMYYAGQRSVVRALEQRLQQSQNDDLTKRLENGE